ncbi:MAG: diguanylate cyclase [Desulfotalea sp.]
MNMRYLHFLLFAIIFSCLVSSENVAYANIESSQPFKIALSQEERNYLSLIDYIPICVDPNWMPYEKIDGDGQYIGLVADYMKLFSDQLGKEFRVIKTDTWKESVSAIEQGRCDILPGAVSTPERRKFLSFSEPYIFLPLVVATTTDELFIIDLEQVLGKTFAIVKGYAAIEILRVQYPNIKIKEVADIKDGLEMIKKGEVYGYISTLPTISYYIQSNGIEDIKISGELDVEYDISIGVRSDHPLLYSIINKTIISVPKQDRQKMLYQWISGKFTKPTDYTLLFNIVCFFVFVILLLLARTIIISRFNKRLTEVNDKLYLLYKTDKLTGLYNRHFLDDELNRGVSLAKRYGVDLSVVLLDIDYFKQVNDTYGHPTGDAVLKDFAEIIKQTLRETDTAGRWGGEEFFVVCPETTLIGAASVAEKLRENIESHEFPNINKQVTASFGVATYHLADTVDSLVKRADQAIYISKKNGRNCVTSEDLIT